MITKCVFCLWCLGIPLVLLSVAAPCFAQGEQQLGSLQGIITPREFARLTSAQRGNLEKLAATNLQRTEALSICWTAGTNAATVAAFERALARQVDDKIATQLGSRWSTTATNGSGLSQGDPTILTWSIVADGTALPGFIGEPASSSNLIAWLGSLYGVTSDNRDYTDEIWFPLFQQSFDRWAQHTGLQYVYEPTDDAATFASSDGFLGQRGDVRIGGHPIDGNGGVLAYNFAPNTSDMVLDTADNFFNDSAANSLRLRNVLMHETGHGIGIRHVESSDAQFLMEPLIDLTFDGPQFDDILGGNRHYGDYDETTHPNDVGGSATSLGAMAVGSTATHKLVSIDDDADADYYSFTVAANTIALASVSPQGFTYSQSSQGSGETPISPQNHADLVLEILDINGLNVLGTADHTGLGGSETLQVPLPGAGTFFVRVRHSQDLCQMYDLSLQIAASCNACVTAVCDTDIIVGNGFGAGSNFQRRLFFTNCGADNGSFHYSVSDTQGWCTTPTGTATLAPGDTLFLKINCAVPGSTPGGAFSTLSLIASSVDCPTVADTCSSLITVDDTVPVAIHGIRALAGDHSVELHWNVGDNWQDDLLGVQVQRAEHSEGPYSNIDEPLPPSASMSYTDIHIQPDHRYWYRLIAIAVDGNVATAPVEVATSSFALETQLHAPSLSSSRRLHIRYDLGRDSTMRLDIYDARGRRVRSLEAGRRARGVYAVEWNGRDDAGAATPRGVYFISLRTDRQNFSRKFVLTH